MKMNLGKYQAKVESALSQLDADKVIYRIWQRDHTIWKPEPTEITNRLSWLTVIDQMRKEITSLKSFSKEIREAGFQYVVLIGMGGSSLGPEVLRATFSKIEGFPDLIVLDSIDPDWIKQVQDRIDLKQTLFLVSSKSGSTIEIQMLLRYFKAQVELVIGVDSAGKHFAAITDEGSPLEKQAAEMEFRRVFINPSDIGGRYSVLSLFGLVPASLAGIEIEKLLESASSMAKACSVTNAQGNPGAFLGTIISSLALKGRDKLTLITSPKVSRFGLWVEQLVAESTGKEGKGIIPIADEPLVEPKYYSDDRLFVFLRLRDDDNSTINNAVEDLKTSGQPVVILEIDNIYDLGAEFFRWEFAIPVAASILGINPFDQPNVQSAKNATKKMIQVHTETDNFPQIKSEVTLENLLGQTEKGKYLSIMAYIVESEETNRLIAEFRRKVVERYHIATMFGYGPRFLHSTGQLHKGGPNNILSLQLTVDHTNDLPIPGEPYTFGQLTNAQAMGDLEVLMKSKRKIANIHFSGGDYAAAKELIDLLS